MMTNDMKLGQKIALGAGKFRIITIVNKQLVCLEPLECNEVSAKVSILQYEHVLKDGRLLEEF